MATPHLALLRGMNVGGKNKLPMAELRAIFEAAGCTQVQSYIQSGNVVFAAEPDLADRIGALIQDSIAEQFGYDIPVVTRTAEEIKGVVQRNPFLERDPDPKALHVVFLADQPNDADLEALDPDRSPQDEYIVSGREIFLLLPNGMARTKLTNAYFDSTLKTVSTARNWRTTLKLLELATG